MLHAGAMRADGCFGTVQIELTADIAPAVSCWFYFAFSSMNALMSSLNLPIEPGCTYIMCPAS